MASTAASILEPTQDNLIALDIWNQQDPLSGGMPDALAAMLYAGGTYVAPTCVADLSPGSPAQQAMEPPNRYPWVVPVRWFPIVGIASDSAAAGALYALLIQYLDEPASRALLDYMFSIDPSIMNDLQLDSDLSELNPTSSDLIVSEQSQRDGCAVPIRYLWHSHSPIPVEGVLAETHSPAIAIHIGRILSSPLEDITLPASGIYVPETVNDVHLFRLGWE